MNELLNKIVMRIYDTNGLLPVNAVQGHKGDYVVSEYVLTPFLFVVKINPLQTSTKQFTNAQLAKDIHLVSGLEKHEQVVIDVHRGFVTIEIPRPAIERNKVVYTSNEVPRGNGLRVVLGLDIFNEPVHFNLAGEMNTNLSFLGVPGSGKSVSMSRTIVSLAQNNSPDDVKFLMLETAKNGIDLEKFAHLPHLVHPVIINPDEAVRALGYVVTQVKQGKLPFRLVICIDEVAELVRQRQEAIELLMSLVAVGRAVNICNLLATQITDKDTLGEGRAIFRQIHNNVLGKANGKQLSYILGGSADLKAEALIGEGDLLLKSNDITTRFAGCFVTKRDMERLPKTDSTNYLPIEEYSNTPAIVEEARAIVPRFEAKPTPANVVIAGLESLQRQMDEPLYRSDMRGKAYYVLPVSQVKALGRNAQTFKERDQPYIVSLYKEMWKRGLRLCNGTK